MDTGEGTFRLIAEEERAGLVEEDLKWVFEIGEEVQVKDSKFRVVAIGDRYIRLQLLRR